MISKEQSYQQLRNELGVAKRQGHINGYWLVVISDLVDRMDSLETELKLLKERKKPGRKPKVEKDAA